MYEQYKLKIIKRYEIWRKIMRYRVLIIATLAVILCASTGLLAATGVVYADSGLPPQITYGEEPDGYARAFLSRTDYEFAPLGSDEWSQARPIYPGSYQVRAVARRAFGALSYGKTHAFTIVPKEIDVAVVQSPTLYGNDPRVSADLAYSDIIACSSFEYEDSYRINTRTTPIIDAIVITDGDGNDVTAHYIIRAVITDFTFEQRNITITLEGAEAVYDGATPLLNNHYEVAGDGLLAGDYITVSTDVGDAPVDAGTVQNPAAVRITSADGGSVGDVYAVTVIRGNLRIKPRPITIATPSAEKIYDGLPLSAEGYTLGGLTPALVVGHSLDVSAWVAPTDAGVHDNVPNFKITGEGGRDVTANYAVEYAYGTLSIAPRSITVKTGSAEKVYDGFPLSMEEYALSGLTPALAQGHSLDISSWAAPTDAGVYDNVLAFKIMDAQSNDVTRDYNITYNYGKLTVHLRALTIATGTNEWIYDGTAKSYTAYTVTSGSGVSGQGFVISHNYTSMTDVVRLPGNAVGSVENILDIQIIIVSTQENVTHNYDISYIYGTLKITPREITVAPIDKEKIYDGFPLTADEFCLTEGSLAENQRAECHFAGSQTIPGIGVSSVASIAVYFGNVDVTANYDVAFEDGELLVHRRPITLRTFDAEKVYDGTPLEYHRYEIIPAPELGGLAIVDGQTADVIVTGWIMEVGETPNTAKVIILDRDGADVTDYYDISVDFGTLIIWPPPVIVGGVDGGGSGEGGGSGFGGNLGGEIDREPFAAGDNVVFYATSSVSEAAYFRIKCFGDYTGDGFSEATYYELGDINGLSLMTLAMRETERIMGYNYMGGNILIEPQSETLPYMLPYYAENGYETKNDVQIFYGDGSPYSIGRLFFSDGSPVPFNLVGDSGAFERIYRSHVQNTYLQLPSATKAELLKIATAQNLSVASNYETITRVVQYVRSRVAYDLNHEEYVGDVALYFFNQAKTGICQHYATAATAMLRALGIPARYTVGFAGDFTAGERTGVTARDAHAWVEVYLPGIGWYQLEVTGGRTGLLFGSGTGGGDWGGGGENGGGEEEDYGILGDSDDSTEDGAGRREIYINLFRLQKTYDGEPLSYKNDDYWVDIGELEGNLPAGYTLIFNLAGSLTDVGQMKISDFYGLTYRVYDENNNNVTSSFSLVLVGELLRVDLCKIEIASGDAIKRYDGTALTNNTIAVSKNFPFGYRCEARVTGTITNPGFVLNTISDVIIFDQYGIDVTRNFDIVLAPGTLTVY